MPHPFRDDAERKAHDIICMLKYGSAGGSASLHDVRRVAEVIRGGPLALVLPKLRVPLPASPGVVPLRLPVVPKLGGA